MNKESSKQVSKKQVSNKEVTRQYFDSTAEDYDNSHDGRFVQCMYREIADRAQRICRAGMRIDRVLDLGCGNGNVIALLKEKIPADYYGLDLSENMIRQAKARLGGEVSLCVGDAEKLPYGDQMFDLLICNASFHHYPHPEAALKEMRRVLRPGGVVLLGDPTFRSRIAAGIFNYFLRYSNSGDAHIWCRKEIEALFEAHGFQVREWKYVERKAFVFHAVNF